MTRISLSLLFFFLSGVALAQVTSSFSSSDESWLYDQGVSTSTNAVGYNAAGGNPGGSIAITVASGSASIYAMAPAKFIGNLSAAYNQTLSFDLKQSVAGTDNSYGDVIITNSAIGSVYYQLSTKPGTSWTVNSVTLNEAGWKFGCATCAAASQPQMKQILSNVTALHIRVKFNTTASSYTGEVDNVTLNTSSVTAGPVITGFAPVSGLPGATVTISGSNFNATASKNTVYFNGVKASISSGNTTQLKVVVPTSAVHGPITVTNTITGQQGRSVLNFDPLFNNNGDAGGQIINSSMGIGNSVALPLNPASYNSFGYLDKGDFDGDGWIDLVTTETGSASIYAFQNQGIGGTVSVSTFPSKMALPSLTTALTTFLGKAATVYLAQIRTIDVDSDGKLDVVASIGDNYNNAWFAVYRNTSTTGISFASPLFFGFAYYSGGVMTAGDLDGDGRPELLSTTGSSPGNTWVCQNLSTPGNIDFGYGTGLLVNSGYGDLEICDLNADGKPEIIAGEYNYARFTIYKNTSTPGTLSFSTFTIPTTNGNQKVEVGDLDGDSKPDLLWSGYGYTSLYLMKNVFNGTTFDATSFGSEIAITNTLAHPTSVGLGDMNADGKADIVAIGYSDAAIFQNNTSAGTLDASSFTQSVVFEGATSGEAVYAAGPVVADLDGDNKPEISMVYTNNVSASNKAVFIFHNESFRPPVITALSSYHAPGNSTITVTGNYLNTNGDTPQLRSQSIIDNTSNLSNASFKANLKLGSGGYRFGITLHGLAAYSNLPIFGTFPSVQKIDASAFSASVDYALGTANPYDGLVVADFDDDGKPDIIASDVVGGYSVADIYRNVGTAGSAVAVSSFTAITNSVGSILHAKADDIDGDGKVDLIVNGLLVQNNSGSQAQAISFSAVNSPVGSVQRIALQHDLNNDGKMDVVVASGSNTINIHQNLSRKGAFLGYGSFQTLPSTPVIINPGATINDLTVADLDGDGWDDIAYGVGGGSPNLTVVRNKGTTSPVIAAAQFAAPVAYTAAPAPLYITTSDVDGDGKLDIVVGNNTSTFISVFLNKSTPGTINFTRQDFPSLTGAVGVAVDDIDGDGKIDIVVIHQTAFNAGSFSIFKNVSTPGSLSFNTHVDYALPAAPVSLVVADVNLDSKPDIVITRAGASGNGKLSIFQNMIAAPSLNVDTQPASNTQVCSGVGVDLIVAASGTSNITYQWQVFNAASGGYADLANASPFSNTNTVTLSINTTGTQGGGQYRCKIDGDFVSTTYTNIATVTVTTLPSAPAASDVTKCDAATFQFSASGATAGQHYNWYDGNGLINGQTSSTYTTLSVSTTTVYDVSIIDQNGCESLLTQVKAVVDPATCNNQPPQIAAAGLSSTIGGTTELDLSSLLSDPDNNLNLASLSIITQPTSGAVATLTSTMLSVDYTGLTFAGTDHLTVQVCDADNACTAREITIEVGDKVKVYNAVSPNGDGKNEFFYLQFIESLDATKNNEVVVYNRWGDEVFSVKDYNNTSNVFRGIGDNGTMLPPGIYLYKVTFASSQPTMTGYLELKY